MPTFLLVFFTCLCLVGIFFLIRWMVIKHVEKKCDQAQKDVHSQRNQLLETIYNIAKKVDKTAGMPVRKIKVIETLNMPPLVLTQLCQFLAKDEMIEESTEGISLTDFGSKYVEIFIKQKAD